MALKKDTSAFFYFNSSISDLKSKIQQIFCIINQYSTNEIVGFGLSFNLEIDQRFSIIGHLEYDLSDEKIKILLDNISNIANQGIVNEDFNIKNVSTQEYLSYPCKAISISDLYSKNIDLFMILMNQMFLTSFNKNIFSF